MHSPSTAVRAQILLLAQLPFLANAAATTAMFIQPLGTDVPVAASIIAANAAVTTYALGCGANFPDHVAEMPPKEQLCQSLTQLTVTQGPSTLAYATATNLANDQGAPETLVRAALHCQLHGTTEAICTNSYDGVDKIAVPTGLDPEAAAEYKAQIDAYKTPVTETLTGDSFPLLGAVQITAGAEKLSGEKQANVTGSATTAAKSSSPASASVTVTTNPAGGGVNTSVPLTTSKPAYVTPTGDAGASHSSSAAAKTTSKSAGTSLHAVSSLTLMLSLATVGILYL